MAQLHQDLKQQFAGDLTQWDTLSMGMSADLEEAISASATMIESAQIYSGRAATRRKTLTIAFIGAGNMAISLIRGLLENGTEATAIVAADPNPEQRMKAADLGITTLEDNNAAIHQAEVIVLAVKPQIAANVVKSLDSINPQHLVISIAAGINLESLQSWLPNHQPVVRCMPNTPALVGAGMTALYANAAVSPTHLSVVEHVLQAAGKLFGQ